MVKALLDAGVFYGPILNIIPHADKLDPKLSTVQEGIETKGYLVPLYRNQTGLLYDPERVSDPPQTWDELVAWINANPKQFAYCDPSKGGSGQAFVQTAIGYLCGGLDKYKGDTELDPEKVKNWDLAWNWMNETEELVTITGSNNESLSRLNQGEVSLVVAWDDDTLINLKKGTLFKRAKLYIPKFGLPGGGDTAGVLKNAEHKAAAILFIAYLTEADTQITMNEINGSYLARIDVEGKQALLPEQERQENGVIWVPGPYKQHFITEFVKNVLMR
jgi:putative spermidine/putrescine transport system substrate-binding protein